LQDKQISVLLLIFSLFLKNPQVVSGRGENVDILLKKTSKWDIKAVTAVCILVVNRKVIKKFHGVGKIVWFAFWRKHCVYM